MFEYFSLHIIAMVSLLSRVTIVSRLRLTTPNCYILLVNKDHNCKQITSGLVLLWTPTPNCYCYIHFIFGRVLWRCNVSSLSLTTPNCYILLVNKDHNCKQITSGLVLMWTPTPNCYCYIHFIFGRVLWRCNVFNGCLSRQTSHILSLMV